MIYLLDFSSLYPMSMIGANVYSPASKDEPYWNGSGVFANKYQNAHDGIRGKYSRTQGSVEKFLEELLIEKGKCNDDPQRRLTIKIILNTTYGVLGCKSFKNIHDKIRAADVTGLSRMMTLSAREIFDDYGIEVLYTDTDSFFVKSSKSWEELKHIVDYIVNVQKDSMNIRCDLHDLKLECLIKHMYFFRDDKGEFVKKHYIYVTTEDKLVIKGLTIKKGNSSRVARIVFDKYIKPIVMKGKPLGLKYETVLKWVEKEIKDNQDLLPKRYRLRDPSEYKIPDGKYESTALNYKLAKKYGAGEHWFVVNTKFGPGKGNHYIPLADLKEKAGKDWIDYIPIAPILSDLKPFIAVEERKKIGKRK